MWYIFADPEVQVPIRALEKCRVLHRDTARSDDLGQKPVLVNIDPIQKRVDCALAQAMKETEEEE